MFLSKVQKGFQSAWKSDCVIYSLYCYASHGLDNSNLFQFFCISFIDKDLIELVMQILLP